MNPMRHMRVRVRSISCSVSRQSGERGLDGERGAGSRLSRSNGSSGVRAGTALSHGSFYTNTVRVRAVLVYGTISSRGFTSAIPIAFAHPDPLASAHDAVADDLVLDVMVGG